MIQRSNSCSTFFRVDLVDGSTFKVLCNHVECMTPADAAAAVMVECELDEHAMQGGLITLVQPDRKPPWGPAWIRGNVIIPQGNAYPWFEIEDLPDAPAQHLANRNISPPIHQQGDA